MTTLSRPPIVVLASAAVRGCSDVVQNASAWRRASAAAAAVFPVETQCARAQVLQDFRGNVMPPAVAEAVVARQLEQRRCMRDGDSTNMARLRNGRLRSALLHFERECLEIGHHVPQPRCCILSTATFCRTRRCFAVTLTEAVHLIFELDYGLRARHDTSEIGIFTLFAGLSRGLIDFTLLALGGLFSLMFLTRHFSLAFFLCWIPSHSTKLS